LNFDGLSGGWTVAVVSTVVVQLGAKTRGDLNHPRNEKRPIPSPPTSLIAFFAVCGFLAGAARDEILRQDGGIRASGEPGSRRKGHGGAAPTHPGPCITGGIELPQSLKFDPWPLESKPHSRQLRMPLWKKVSISRDLNFQDL
jgi:hypothetical protein